MNPSPSGERPLALYVHWPFCVSKCPYCDFNSHVRAEIDEAAWRDALLADLAHEASLTPDRALGSIFFGGGTPSLMAPATVAAVLDAAQAAFARVSIDLIYARPDQSEAAWLAELDRAIQFDTEHLSLYQLTIEPGTQFAALAAKGQLPTLDTETAANLFELTRAVTAAAGIPAYEISNHARPGAESRHNLTYWRYRDYLGVGPGAHGRRGGLATVRRKKPENWLAAVARNGHGLESETPLDPGTRAMEALLMGLRLGEGVDLAALSTRLGLAIDAMVDTRAVDRLAEHGLIRSEGDRLVVQEPGMLLLDGILGEIVR